MKREVTGSSHLDHMDSRHLDHMEHGGSKLESLVALHKGYTRCAEEGDEFSQQARTEIAAQLARIGLYVDH